MKLLIIFIGLYAVLSPLVSRFTSYLAEHWDTDSRGGIPSEDFESSVQNVWEDGWLNDHSEPTSSFINTGEYDAMVSSCEINPANGLPMLGCIDIAGNAYGTDSHHWSDTFSMDSSSMFDDTFSSSSISSFDN